MVAIKSLLSTAILVSSAFGAAILRRQDEGQSCGNTYYSNSAVNAAIQQGYNYYQEGQEVHSYPHTYNDYEGFTFDNVEGPYQEFPILSSGNLYTGGSPGADRVIFNTNGEYAGVITHTGASGNDFVACSSTD
ncbi:ribonuclease-domain-containing protein [Myriangium duriaei CBS 260.36]|uniref:ribonuclease T1 n=1 Tax=Myriangium duriaei CBS 260.36 TaxID=1168546 RepID=A0A9P4MHZ3_9PEZI|nr:ribonuclease-domain-containing protein [Myriangium duriaei CBS 260.36]